MKRAARARAGPAPGAPEPGVLRVHSAREGDMHVIALDGELCLVTARDVEEALRRALLTSASVVVVDLRGLRFIDSRGIRLILQAHQRAPLTGSRLLLVRGPRAVQRPFELCGLADRLPFVDAVVPHAT